MHQIRKVLLGHGAGKEVSIVISPTKARCERVVWSRWYVPRGSRKLGWKFFRFRGKDHAGKKEVDDAHLVSYMWIELFLKAMRIVEIDTAETIFRSISSYFLSTIKMPVFESLLMLGHRSGS
jgi:hypothetical protein